TSRRRCCRRTATTCPRPWTPRVRKVEQAGDGTRTRTRHRRGPATEAEPVWWQGHGVQHALWPVAVIVAVAVVCQRHGEMGGAPPDGVRPPAFPSTPFGGFPCLLARPTLPATRPGSTPSCPTPASLRPTWTVPPPSVAGCWSRLRTGFCCH